MLLATILSFPSKSSLGAEIEAEVKAVFLERFTRFIDWPQNNSNPSTSFNLCVLQDQPFTEVLTALYRTKTIKNKPISIIPIENEKQIEVCELLFIPASFDNQLSEILAATHGRPILTIGESHEAAVQGIIIGLYFQENKPRFSINERALQASKLHMSNQLLRIAKLVEPTVKSSE